MIGKVLGQYRLIQILGSGASATVYLGEHVSIARKAAVKVLHPHLAGDEGSIERLRREAQALSALNHPNIVRIYDFVLEKGNAFIVFEYVEGRTLRQFVDAHPDLPPELASAFLEEICRAVAAAHELAIIHRDIKPENILLTRDGRVKLTDFSIARLTEMENLTITGSLLGSPNFMSPEQIECFPVDKTSDVFSLGVLFYYLLTRAYPFGAKTQARIIRNVLSGRYVQPDAISLRAHPLAVRIVDRCLKKKPGERFASVNALAEKLSELNRCFGFQDAADQVRRAITDYDSFRPGFEQRLIEGLVAFARKARGGGRRVAALSAVNHALLLDGSSRAVRRLRRRLRFAARSALGGVAAAVFIAACVLFVLRFTDSRWKNPAPAPPPPPAAPAESAAVPAAPPGADLPAGPSVPPSKADRAPPPLPRRADAAAPKETAAVAVPPPEADAPAAHEEPAPPAPAGYGTLKLFTRPWAKLYIDNEYRGKTPFVGEFTLTSGKHVVRMENPYCLTVTDTVPLAADSTVVRRYELKRNP